MLTVITTVGTSLLTNRDRPWAGWRFGQPLPLPEVVDKWLETADPIQASAEIHTWYRLELLEDDTNAKIRLVHSQTEDGCFCTERLCNFARTRGLETETRPVVGLSYSDAKTFNRGLRHLVRLLAEEIHLARAEGEVAIAATGGFKAEIAVANLVAALLGAPVYYIYEQFQELIRLEALPVALAPEWLREGPGRALLGRLAAEDCLPVAQVDSLLKTDGRLEMLIDSEQIDGRPYVCPNLLGTLAAKVVEAPVMEWPTTTQALPEGKIQLDQASHHRPRGWERVVDDLARNPFVRRIRYDRTAGVREGIFEAPDNHNDLFVVLAGNGAPPLALRVSTTAENAQQRGLVRGHLRQRIALKG